MELQENLDKFRIQSPPFNVTFPENNVFGISPGPTQAVSHGLWVILKPPPPGEHKIGFKGISVDFTTGAKNTFVSDANYNVIVRWDLSGIINAEILREKSTIRFPSYNRESS